MAARQVLVAAALCALLAVGVCGESGAPVGVVDAAGAPAAGAPAPAAQAAPAAPVAATIGSAERSERTDAPAAAVPSQDSEEETNRKIRAAFKAGDRKSAGVSAGGAVSAPSAPASDSVGAQPVTELHGNTRHVMDVADKTPAPAGGTSDLRGSVGGGAPVQGQPGDKMPSATEGKTAKPTSATSSGAAGAGCTTATLHL